jgi:SAM-dependent methyltransferase
MHQYNPENYDPTLFAGTASYYTRYREAYDPVFIEILKRQLQLDGTGRLLDVGCGTGNIIVPLAPYFSEAVGVDPDADMLAEASRAASAAGATYMRFVKARAESLPLNLGTFDLITMAQSFHWMDRARVLDILHAMLRDGGALAHIGNVPVADSVGMEGNPTNWPGVRAVVERYLGPKRRAGVGLYHEPGPHEPWFEASRFGPGQTFYAKTGHRRVRDLDDVIGLIFSESGTARHLFGEHVDAFEKDVRAALLAREPSGQFPYVSSDIDILLVRK